LKHLYVGHGGRDAGHDYGLVGVIDSNTGRLLDDIKVTAHPAEVLIEPSGSKLFVAVYPSDVIDVIDRVNHKRVATWPVPQASHPAVMDIDEQTHRLFVAGTSKQLVVLDAGSGKQVASVPCVD